MAKTAWRRACCLLLLVVSEIQGERDVVIYSLRWQWERIALSLGPRCVVGGALLGCHSKIDFFAGRFGGVDGLRWLCLTFMFPWGSIPLICRVEDLFSKIMNLDVWWLWIGTSIGGL